MFIHIQIHGGIVWKYAFYSLALWGEILYAELASANDTNKPEFLYYSSEGGETEGQTD